MTWFLQGPFFLDPMAVGTSTRTALLAGEARVRAAGARWERPSEADGRAPGLYLLWNLGENPHIVGFWVVFGSEYLDNGPMGPPDLDPPYAAEILTAATEAVWWKNLPTWGSTASGLDRDWTPLVVLEWPPELANRCALPPPGVQPVELRKEEEALVQGQWLDTGPSQRARTTQVQVQDDATEHAEAAPSARRSLVSIVRGHLQKRGTRHRAHFDLVSPDRFPVTSGGAIPLDTWIQTSIEEAPTPPRPGEDPAWGPPLELPHGGAGYPLTGWLTRPLTVWPVPPRTPARGSLRDRDIGGRWGAQARRIVITTLGVLGVVFCTAWLVRAMGEPRLEEAQTTADPKPMPALSVCSANHEEFVNELRCQLQAAGDAAIGQAGLACRDGAEGTSGAGDRSLDLQPIYCGLLDQTEDSTGQAFPPAHHVAAQACFNVLGQPYRYQSDKASIAPPVRGGEPSSKVADPYRFLVDEKLRVVALGDMVANLDKACDHYRRKMELRVEGAIYASAVGWADPRMQRGDSEAGDFRAYLSERATRGMTDLESTCFESGAWGASAAQVGPRTYESLCAGGPQDPSRPAEGAVADQAPSWKGADNEGAAAFQTDAWSQLGARAPWNGRDEAGVVQKYTQARFDPYLSETHPVKKAQRWPGIKPLWQCHLQLSRLAGSDTEAADGVLSVLWRRTVPIPWSYLSSRPLDSQFDLDAAIGTISAGSQGSVCWDVVVQRLRQYVPVYPLLGQPDPTLSEPSVEERLCGQVCAVRYGLRPPPDGRQWVTQERDLAMCLESRRPGSLTLPWGLKETQYGDTVEEAPENGASTNTPPAAKVWTWATEEDICAFNLVAQGYFEGSGVILDNVPAPVWARGVGGDTQGLAVQAAENLGSYGQSRSRTTCGYVATQCFASAMLGVLKDNRPGPYRVDAWRNWLQRAVDAPPRTLSPWCRLIQPYMSRDGTLPEGQLDYPCAMGIDETRAAFEVLVKQTVSGPLKEARP